VKAWLAPKKASSQLECSAKYLAKHKAKEQQAIKMTVPSRDMQRLWKNELESNVRGSSDGSTNANQSSKPNGEDVRASVKIRLRHWA
jgi:hypothetical protein